MEAILQVLLVLKLIVVARSWSLQVSILLSQSVGDIHTKRPDSAGATITTRAVTAVFTAEQPFDSILDCSTASSWSKASLFLNEFLIHQSEDFRQPRLPIHEDLQPLSSLTQLSARQSIDN